MILVSKTYWAGEPWTFRNNPEGARPEPLVLRADDFRTFRALYWTPQRNPAPRTAVVAMHPRVDFTRHYTFPRLLDAGYACLGANTRHPGSDLDTVHEDIVLDLAACVKYLKQKRDVERVVLLGNSGGGSLAAYFQAQALLPPDQRLETTPGGDATRFAHATMIPANGMIYIAAHRGQGKVLGECIDPAVPDEDDPLAVDPALDMYDPKNGFAAPPAWSEYDPAFVRRYREAQRGRVARLDLVARELIRRAADAASETASDAFASRPEHEQRAVWRRRFFQPVMTVYRTMANLHYVDGSLDPSPRDYGSLLSDRPDLMNMQLLGFARVCTPRAWLSTWSALASNAHLVDNVARIPQPTLLAYAGADREIFPRTDIRPIADAVVAEDKTFLEFHDARHYFEPAPGSNDTRDADRLMDAVIPWIAERFPP